MTRRKQKVFLFLLALFVLAAAILALWYFAPKTFLKGIEAAEVKTISVFDGNSGKSFQISDPEEIRAIVENIQAYEMRRDKLSIAYSGFGFRMYFNDENGTVLDSFIMNTAGTILCDPFFYRCDGGLCFAYLAELEVQYAD